MTADRSTVESWLRKLEKACDEHEPGSTYRAFVFRQVLNDAWIDGRGRGYDDCQDDVYRAARDAKNAAKEKQQNE